MKPNRWARWAGRGGLAVADHGLVSAGNLAVGVGLARLLGTGEYGAFAAVWALLLLVAGLHNGVLLEPMSVLGPAKYAARLHGYLRDQLRLHVLLTTAAAVPFLLAAPVVATMRPADGFGADLAAAGALLPLVLAPWTTRRIAYVLGRPGSAALGSVAYFTVAVAGLWGLPAVGAVSGASGFAVVGLASALAAVVSLATTGLGLGWGTRGAGPRRLQLLREQWRYGRWLVLAGVLSWLANQSFILVVTALAGSEPAGILRAMQIPALGMIQVTAALSTAALPYLAADSARAGGAGAGGRALLAGGLVGTAAAAEAVLVLFARPVERLLFGGKFADYAFLIPIFGLGGLFGALTAGPSLTMRAAQRPDLYVVVGLVAAVVGVGATVVLTSAWGVTGAALGVVAGSAASAAAASAMQRRWLRRVEVSGRA